MNQSHNSKSMRVYLRQHEALALEILARENGVSAPEILRIGLRLLWRLHKRGAFRVPPRYLWRSVVAADKHKKTQRRKPYHGSNE